MPEFPDTLVEPRKGCLPNPPQPPLPPDPPAPFSTTQNYALPGPQEDPEASFWHARSEERECPLICMVRPEDLGYDMPPYPDDPREEIEELRQMAQRRDDPGAITQFGLAISPLLQLRPPPIGAVFNRLRPELPPAARVERELSPSEIPVIRTGRELARYFERETPGLPHRTALNALFAQGREEFVPGPQREMFSPFQALVWMMLDVGVYSAQLAAWYYKFRYDPPVGGRVRFRPRPVEVDPRVDVLFNRRVNDTQSGDDGLRRLPVPSPGTPRHPAYPSGHSVTYAAASEICAFFFPDLRGEWDQLADNAGVARLWAGVHYRSDHTEGMNLGRAVGRAIIDQLRETCICPPDPCNPRGDCDAPPTPDHIDLATDAALACCTATSAETSDAAQGEAPQPDQA